MSTRLLRITLCSILAGVALGSVAVWKLRSANRAQPATHVPRLAGDHTPPGFPPPHMPAAPSAPTAVTSPATNPSPPPTLTPIPGVPSSRSESQGPFELDGVKFTLKVDWLCRNFDKNKNECADNFGETAESYSLIDPGGNIQFHKTFSGDIRAYDTSLQLSALRLVGRSHQALQVATSEAPSAPDTGFSSDFFALHDGKLAKLAEGIPVGVLAPPEGTAQPSWKLPADDVIVVRQFGSLYYDTLAHFRFNWREGKLDQVESNEFEVEPHQGEHPQDAAVDFYPAPDFHAKPIRVHLGRATKIAILKIVRTVTSQDSAGKPVVTEWLRISIDGRKGYISGDADFGAIGLEIAG